MLLNVRSASCEKEDFVAILDRIPDASDSFIKDFAKAFCEHLEFPRFNSQLEQLPSVATRGGLAFVSLASLCGMCEGARARAICLPILQHFWPKVVNCMQYFFRGYLRGKLQYGRNCLYPLNPRQSDRCRRSGHSIIPVCSSERCQYAPSVPPEGLAQMR